MNAGTRLPSTMLSNTGSPTIPSNRGSAVGRVSWGRTRIPARCIAIRTTNAWTASPATRLHTSTLIPPPLHATNTIVPTIAFNKGAAAAVPNRPSAFNNSAPASATPFSGAVQTSSVNADSNSRRVSGLTSCASNGTATARMIVSRVAMALSANATQVSVIFPRVRAAASSPRARALM